MENSRKTRQTDWERYRQHLIVVPAVEFTLDPSGMDFESADFDALSGAMNVAFDAMDRLEAGEIANPDENRRVGHYWLRTVELVPDTKTATEILQMRDSMRQFARDVHAGKIAPPAEGRFENLLIIGIGGSALGPQFIADALGSANDTMRVHFLDNTDPDGMDRVFAGLKGMFNRTLALVISKSGGTAETRNGMIEAARAYQTEGIEFAKCAVAVTGEGSELSRRAADEKWLAQFPMWDWVGGRTSLFSAVGLLPAALQGIDDSALLDGAREMDAATRIRDPRRNPAAALALLWHHAGKGRGLKDMVILPYKDRLILFSRYLQQLVMESLGKERDLSGKIVHQGIAVYGNKGSTDQHAYVQQLREGINNFFVTFIEVLRDREGEGVEVEPGITSGDYLHGFLLGTRRALRDNGRETMTITIPDVSARSLGALIALFERAVGFYATLVGINAYHQPGVEAGKKAAAAVLALQKKVVAELATNTFPRTAAEIASAIGAKDDVEHVYMILRRLAVNPGRGVARTSGDSPESERFKRK